GAEHVLLAHEREDDEPRGDVQSDQTECREEPRPDDRPRGPHDRETAEEFQRREDDEERHDDRLNVLPNRDDVDRAVCKEEERGEDATTADPVQQDLRMIDCVSEKQEAQTQRDRRPTNEDRRAETTARAETTRDDELSL